MTFQALDATGVCDDCTVVQAEGRLVDGSASEYWGFIARTKLKKNVIVVVHSSGGSMTDAAGIGSAIRKLQARTIVGRAYRKGAAIEIAPGRCFSACVSMFVGGIKRAVPGGSVVGVHSWLPTSLVETVGQEGKPPRLFTRQAVRNLNLTNARLMEHFDKMGVDLRIMIRALQTPYERIVQLNGQELREWRVVTGDALVESRPNLPRPVLAPPSP